MQKQMLTETIGNGDEVGKTKKALEYETLYTIYNGFHEISRATG